MSDLKTQTTSISDNSSSDEVQIRPLDHLSSRSVLTPQPFTSSIPLLGRVVVWFRSTWNSVSTRWYLAPLLQQQSEFNQTVVHELHVLNNLNNELNNELQALSNKFQSVNGELQILNDEFLALATAQSELKQIVDELSDRLIANDKDVATLSHDLGKVVYTVNRLRDDLTGPNDAVKSDSS
jgi:hypothetical protein